MGLSAWTASRKKRLTTASLYFCWVSTASNTSATSRMARARCQLTSTSESTSGASITSRRSGRLSDRRQNSRSSADSCSGSSALLHDRSSKGVNQRASSCGSSAPAGTRQTGCRVPAARGLTPLATSPARWLKMTDLPIFVPPTMAATSSGRSSSWARSLRPSSSNHCRPASGATPMRWAAWSSRLSAASSERTFSANVLKSASIGLTGSRLGHQRAAITASPSHRRRSPGTPWPQPAASAFPSDPDAGPKR